MLYSWPYSRYRAAVICHKQRRSNMQWFNFILYFGSSQPCFGGCLTFFTSHLDSLVCDHFHVSWNEWKMFLLLCFVDLPDFILTAKAKYFWKWQKGHAARVLVNSPVTPQHDSKTFLELLSEYMAGPQLADNNVKMHSVQREQSRNSTTNTASFQNKTPRASAGCVSNCNR